MSTESRRTHIFLMLGLANLLLLGGVAWRHFGATHLERAALTYRAGAFCLLGEGTSTAERRLRAHAVAADTGHDDGTWPRRCAPVLHQSRRSIDRELIERRSVCDSATCCPGDDLCERLSRLRAEVDKAMRFADLGLDFDPTDFAAMGADLGWLDRSVPSGSPAPPEPTPLLDPDRMNALFTGNYLRLLTDPDGARRLDLLFYEHESRYELCTVERIAASTADCNGLDDEVPVGLAGELFSRESNARRVMYAQGFLGGPEKTWHHGLYDVDTGAELTGVPFRPRGGFVWEDGSFAWVGHGAPLRELGVFRHGPEGEPVGAESLIAREDGVSPRLIHDVVLWSEMESDTQHRLFARHLGPQRLGPKVDLGRVETDALRVPSIDVCRTRVGLNLLVLGHRSETGARGTLLRRVDDGDTTRWLPPEPIFIDARRFGFTCQDDTATLTWIFGEDEQSEEIPSAWGEPDPPITGRYQVSRLRCTNDGCDRADTSLVLRRHHARSRYVAGDLGRATVILWRSELGDVRMRVSPLAQLATAPDIPLFDDPEHDGFGWDLERDPIFGRAGDMIVLTSRQIEGSLASATYGFRVDASGTVTPLRID